LGTGITKIINHYSDWHNSAATQDCINITTLFNKYKLDDDK